MTGTVAGCREKMYREQARLVCTKQAEYYSKMMGVTYGRIAIKNTRTRWGSCRKPRFIFVTWTQPPTSRTIQTCS